MERAKVLVALAAWLLAMVELHGFGSKEPEVLCTGRVFAGLFAFVAATSTGSRSMAVACPQHRGVGCSRSGG